MHKSSYDEMVKFKEAYLADKTDDRLVIVDIGSMDVNGSYRPIFDPPAWKYIGVDVEPGKNVNLVIKNPYRWKTIPSGFADVVISGQAFEHIEYPWITIREIKRILKAGGLLCIIAPSSGPEHKYPVDCWRIYPDGFRALAKFAGLKILDVHCRQDLDEYKDGSSQWKDCVLIGLKPPSMLIGKLYDMARSIKN